MLSKTSLISVILLLFININHSFGQSVESFDKIKIKGNISANFHTSLIDENKIIITENDELVKYKIKNNNLIIKHKKPLRKKDQKVKVDIYGSPLKEIIIKNFAFLTIEEEMESNSLKAKVVTGGELRTNLKAETFTINVRTGGFGYLKGNIDSLTLKASTGAKFRANEANIISTCLQVKTGGFAAFNGNTNISGRLSFGGELKISGKTDLSKIKKSTRSIITIEDEDR